MPNSIRLNLVVLRSRDIERLRAFYESIGLSFIEERHGAGPMHYASQQEGVVLEIYPTKKENQDKTMLGFTSANIEATMKKLGQSRTHRPPFETDEGRAAILRDPDGRLVYLLERP